MSYRTINFEDSLTREAEKVDDLLPLCNQQSRPQLIPNRDGETISYDGLLELWNIAGGLMGLKNNQFYHFSLA